MSQIRSLMPSILAAVLAFFFVETTGYRLVFINDQPALDYVSITVAFLVAVTLWGRVKIGQRFLSYLSRALTINLLAIAALSLGVALFRVYEFFLERGYVDMATMIEDIAMFFGQNLMLLAQPHMFIGYALTSILCAVLAVFLFRGYVDDL